uniref:Uncharacterized protein n=1 Tax=Triticum urartu TaxID=4572 RepID=A0A8R7VJE5_TRIUA
MASERSAKQPSGSSSDEDTEYTSFSHTLFSFLSAWFSSCNQNSPSSPGKQWSVLLVLEELAKFEQFPASRNGRSICRTFFVSTLFTLCRSGFVPRGVADPSTCIRSVSEMESRRKSA